LFFGLNDAALAAPLLPGPVAQQLGLHLAWAVVLAALASALATALATALARGLAPRWRLGLTIAAALAALVPGPNGVVWWLGLAFQSPSIASVALAAVWLIGRAFTSTPPGAVQGPPPPLSPSPSPPPQQHQVSGAGLTVKPGHMVAAAVVALLGWVLLLDTLALLPQWPLLPRAIYPSGFGFGALAGLLALAVLLCALPASRMAGAGLLLVGAVFAVTRLPTGNLWDALLDPWLWLLAQGLLVRAALGAVRRRRVRPRPRPRPRPQP
jgi:hypothetical protein